jgi:hypothetical protein
VYTSVCLAVQQQRLTRSFLDKLELEWGVKFPEGTTPGLKYMAHLRENLRSVRLCCQSALFAVDLCPPPPSYTHTFGWRSVVCDPPAQNTEKKMGTRLATLVLWLRAQGEVGTASASPFDCQHANEWRPAASVCLCSAMPHAHPAGWGAARRVFHKPLAVYAATEALGWACGMLLSRKVGAR